MTRYDIRTHLAGIRHLRRLKLFNRIALALLWVACLVPLAALDGTNIGPVTWAVALLFIVTLMAKAAMDLEEDNYAKRVEQFAPKKEQL